MKTQGLLQQAQEDWRTLDGDDFVVPPSVRVLTNISDLSNDEVKAEIVQPNWFVRLFKKFSRFYNFLYMMQIIYSADKNSVTVIDGSGSAWLFAGYINRFLVRHRRVMILSDCFLEYHLGKEHRFRFFPFVKFKTEWKIALARGALLGYDTITLWSRKQIAPHAKMFNLPEERFCFIPFKSNHSKRVSYDLQIGEFIFSGGNGKRDYPCLIEAVRGTEIPVIISATDPNVRKDLKFLPNVIILGAPEPAYAQMIAASQFTVSPSTYSGLKGGAETFCCESMWHSKAVIACCSIAAEDYIVDGETGYVLPSGDVEGLRKRILELWNNPDKCKEMGRKGREYCEKYFTHELYIRRHLRLALVVFDEYGNVG
jgi:glycosyltransferase involved in cell wall biosynthesis